MPKNKNETTNWPAFSCCKPRSVAMAGSAGSMASVESAANDVIIAMRATNSPNPSRDSPVSVIVVMIAPLDLPQMNAEKN